MPAQGSVVFNAAAASGPDMLYAVAGGSLVDFNAVTGAQRWLFQTNATVRPRQRHHRSLRSTRRHRRARAPNPDTQPEP